jgi:hypothetical protein
MDSALLTKHLKELRKEEFCTVLYNIVVAQFLEYIKGDSVTSMLMKPNMNILSTCSIM